MFDDLFSSIDLLEKGLDASWLRNQVIANNIANVDTAGFKSSSVEFESAFKEALEEDGFTTKTTREEHINFSDSIDDITAAVVTDTGTTYGMDENNVDIDYQSTELAKNTIYYNTLVQQISSEFRKLSMAINGGE